MNTLNRKGTAIFENTYVHRGLLSVFYAGGSKPLENWAITTQYGYIKRFFDPDLKMLVLEIEGRNVSTSYITCPKYKCDTLGISLPFFVMVAKNLKKYFAFEVTILDNSGRKRRFRVANFQSTTSVMPMSTAMPIGLADGWNQIQFNLSDFTYRAYKTSFVKVLRVRVNASILLRRIYFAERLMSDDELPDDYKLFIPPPTKSGRKRNDYKKYNGKNEENIKLSSHSLTDDQFEVVENPTPSTEILQADDEERDDQFDVVQNPAPSTECLRADGEEKKESRGKTVDFQAKLTVSKTSQTEESLDGSMRITLAERSSHKLIRATLTVGSRKQSYDEKQMPTIIEINDDDTGFK